MPSSQQLAIQLALENVNQVVTGINNVTQAWVTQHKTITKNFLVQQAMMSQNLAVMAQLATAAMNMTGAATAAGDNLNSFARMGVNGISNLSDSVGNLAGMFKGLGTVVGGIGAAIGLALGGPGGALIGGALGGLSGNIFGVFLDIPFKIISGFGKAFEFIINGIAGIGKSIYNLVFGPLSLFGLAVGNIFKDMFTGVKDFAASVFDAAAAFQQLEISMETLTRRNIAIDQGIDIISVSADQAATETKELFDWLKQISLTSPFTMQSIADAMKFASAMGLSTDMTKSLTIATGNFAAAMGLSQDHQYRIMYNLAQIYQQGKLTGREFRDLAISFVPVYDILGQMAKEAGMTTEAFKKLALEGGVPVTDFFKHFIDYMGKNFPDAMEKMSKTMTGVKNNIKDFIQVVLGMEVLGPLMDRISGRLADILDSLLSPKTHAIATDWGQGLARAFDVVAEAVDELGATISDLMQSLGFHLPTLKDFEYAWVKIYLSIKYSIGLIRTVVGEVGSAILKYIVPIIKTLGGAQGESGNWGVNLIKNFAEGIVRGAAKFLATAIMYVAAIIKGFFQANSPPKVAPQINKWGASMINTWISGAVNQANWNALGQGVSTQVNKQMGLYHPPPPQMGTLDTGPEGTSAEDYAQSITENVEKAVSSVSYFVTEQGLRLAAFFMHGFGEADFSILDEIQGPLKSAIEALSSLGQIGKAQGIEMFYNMSQDLIAAIDQFNKTGEISSNLINEITNLGMGLGPELADLVKKEFDLARATKDAAAAQQRLDDAVRALGDARKHVHTLVREYNALVRAGTDKKILKSKLQQINAGEAVVTQAEKEKVAAEQNKKAADDRVTAMKELVTLQSKLVDNMLELINTQNEALSGAGSATEDLTEAMGDLGTALDNVKFDWTAFDWKGAEKDLEPGIADFFANLGDKFGTTFQTTLSDLDTSGAATAFVENLKTQIKNALGINIVEDKWVEHALHGKDRRAKIKSPSFFQQVVDAIFGGQVNWTKAIGNVVGVITGIVTKGLVNATASIFQEGTLANSIYEFCVSLGLAVIKGIGKGLIDGLAQWADQNQDTVDLITALGSGNVAQIMAAIAKILVKKGWRKLNEEIPGSKMGQKINTPPVNLKVPIVVEPDYSAATQPGKMDWDALSKSQQLAYLNMGTDPSTWTYNGQAIVHIPISYQLDWESKQPTPAPKAIKWSDIPWLQQNLLQASGADPNTWTYQGAVVLEIPASVKLAYTSKNSPNNIGASIAGGIQKGHDDSIADWMAGIANWIQTNVFDKILGGIGGGSPATMFVPIGTSMVEGILKGFSDMVTSIIGPNGAIATEINRIINSIKSAFGIGVKGRSKDDSSNPFYSAGQSIIEGLIAGFNSMIQPFKDAWNAIVDLLPDTISDRLHIDSPSKVMMDIGADVVRGLALGIEDSTKLVESAMDKIYVAVPDSMTYNQASYAPYSRTGAPSVISKVNNVTFGDVYLNNNMDYATFRAMVQKVIIEG